MILASQGELTMLLKGSVRDLTVPKPKPRKGAKKARCRWTPGRDYVVTARATRDEAGEVDQKERSVRVNVVEIRGDETDSPAWVVTVSPRAKAEPRAFLAADPGAQRGDYVPTPGRAMSDEGEVLDEGVADRLASLAKAERLNRRPDTRPWA